MAGQELVEQLLQISQHGERGQLPAGRGLDPFPPEQLRRGDAGEPLPEGDGPVDVHLVAHGDDLKAQAVLGHRALPALAARQVQIERDAGAAVHHVAGDMNRPRAPDRVHGRGHDPVGGLPFDPVPGRPAAAATGRDRQRHDGGSSMPEAKHRRMMGEPTRYGRLPTRNIPERQLQLRQDSKPRSPAGSRQPQRLEQPGLVTGVTNLMELTVDTSWWSPRRATSRPRPTPAAQVGPLLG